jgi:hypothetical protein
MWTGWIPHGFHLESMGEGKVLRRCLIVVHLVVTLSRRCDVVHLVVPLVVVVVVVPPRYCCCCCPPRCCRVMVVVVWLVHVGLEISFSSQFKVRSSCDFVDSFLTLRNSTSTSSSTTTTRMFSLCFLLQSTNDFSNTLLFRSHLPCHLDHNHHHISPRLMPATSPCCHVQPPPPPHCHAQPPHCHV